MGEEKMHLVVEIGGEGGRLSLFVSKLTVMPNYVLTTVDQSLTFIDEGNLIEGELGRSKSWRGALKLLDIYPWHMLYPRQINSEYRKRILDAALRRLAKESSSHADSRVRKWKQFCGSPQISS